MRELCRSSSWIGDVDLGFLDELPESCLRHKILKFYAKCHIWLERIITACFLQRNDAIVLCSDWPIRGSMKDSGKRAENFPATMAWPSSTLIPLLIDDRAAGIACS